MPTCLLSHKPSKLDKEDHTGHCWRSKDELTNDISLWTPADGHTRVGQLAKTYTHQLCADIGCSLEDLPEVTNDRDGERESLDFVLSALTMLRMSHHSVLTSLLLLPNSIK